MKKCPLNFRKLNFGSKQPFVKSFAILLMLCLLFQSVLPAVNAKAENGRYVNASYDEANDSVIFKVKADNALYGYVMCKANGWARNDEYKFERKASDTSKTDEMEVSIKYDKLTSGEHVDI